MKKFNYTLTALFTASLLFSCGDSSSSNSYNSSTLGSWTSADKKACVEEIISNPDLEMDEFNEIGIDPIPIAECMCGVFEKGFDSWEETGNTVWDDEWAINNEMLALEAAGCLFSALGDMELGDLDFSEIMDEDFDAEIDAEFDEAMEELDAAMEEFDEAMEELDDALEDLEW